MNVHTIGDRANNVILDVIKKLAEEKGLEAVQGRFRLEHAQIMTLPDIKRAAELGGEFSTPFAFQVEVRIRLIQKVIGSYQPTHATSDVCVLSV